jgi:hypothetical protein
MLRTHYSDVDIASRSHAAMHQRRRRRRRRRCRLTSLSFHIELLKSAALHGHGDSGERMGDLWMKDEARVSPASTPQFEHPVSWRIYRSQNPNPNCTRLEYYMTTLRPPYGHFTQLTPHVLGTE